MSPGSEVLWENDHSGFLLGSHCPPAFSFSLISPLFQFSCLPFQIVYPVQFNLTPHEQEVARWAMQSSGLTRTRVGQWNASKLGFLEALEATESLYGLLDLQIFNFFYSIYFAELRNASWDTHKWKMCKRKAKALSGLCQQHEPNRQQCDFWCSF